MAIFTSRDLLISIGGGCMTEFQLRDFAVEKYLLTMSFPLDWTLSTLQGSITYVYSALFNSSSLEYGINWDRGMPSFDGRDEVFLWHLPKQIGINDEFASSHNFLRENYLRFDDKIRLRYEYLDRRFKHSILNARSTRLIFSYCQPNYVAAFKAFTNLFHGQLALTSLAFRQLTAISEVVDEIIILCPSDSIFSEKVANLEGLATIIWTKKLVYCDCQDMLVEVNYKGVDGWIKNIIPRILV
jgi:hypothetical protein